MKSLLIGLFVVFVFSGITGCSAPSEDCLQIVRNKCISCHGMEHTCREENKSIEYWENIINDMNNFGAYISRKERKIIVGCLEDVETFNEICKPDK